MSKRGFWAVLLGLVGCLLLIYFTPFYPFKGGRPTFDEVHYLHLLRFGWNSVVDGTTQTYYASKSLPFLMANALFDYEQRDWDFLTYYWDMRALNLIFLAFSAWCIFRILRIKNLGHLTPFALVLLLVNRAFLSFYVYYPTLPDIFVLVPASFFLLGHFQKSAAKIWISLVAALFTSPQLVLVIIIYLGFSKWKTALPSAAAVEPESRPNHIFWALVFGVPVLAMSLWGMFVEPDKIVAVAEAWVNPKYFKEPWVLVLSYLAAVIALWFVVTPLSHWGWRAGLRAISFWPGVIGVAVAFSSVTYVNWTSTKKAEEIAYGSRGLWIIQTYLVSKPFVGVISQVITFGLIGIFAILTWRALSRWIASNGIGLTLGAVFSLAFFGVHGEVRHAILLLPLLVVGICETSADLLKRIGLPKLIWGGLVLACNGFVFLYLDPEFRGERHLSAFGMCWSPQHYFAALAIAGAALWIASRARLRDSAPASPSDAA